MYQVRQGDVLLTQRRHRSNGMFDDTTRPRGPLPPTHNTAPGCHVVAEGEKTGHVHVLEGDIWVDEERNIIHVGNDGATLIHTSDPLEHESIDLEAGQYDVTLQREWSYDPAVAQSEAPRFRFD